MVLIIGIAGSGVHMGGDSLKADKAGSTENSFDIGVVIDSGDNSLFLLEPETDTLYGPYLQGELGAGNAAVNCRILPDGKTALITNSNAYPIYFISMPDRFGQAPEVTDSINIGYGADKSAISPDGKTALVSYNGTEKFIATVDTVNRSLLTIYNLPEGQNVTALDIAADNQTVLLADSINSRVHVLLLDPAGNLSPVETLALGFQPCDIAVSPDGLTAIAVNPTIGTPAVLRLDAPGKVSIMEENPALAGSLGVAATFHGTTLCYLSTPFNLRLFSVNGPGNVTDSGSIEISDNAGVNVAAVNTGAVSIVGNWAYIHQKASGPADGVSTDQHLGITVLDLERQNKAKTLNSVAFPAHITFGLMTPDAADASNQLPFGSFDTPVNNATVRSSIAVTGWALDDGGVDSVKLYRQQGSNLIYIGDAAFIEGARPDVAAAYPNYPNNNRAGWGYMLLTNFFPNNGNGTYKLHAVAIDGNGQKTTLGIKTIYCDNAHAVKPFGAIDTPGQGATISGTNYRIQGWTLTPQPNMIPINGSTIDVRIDGVNIGHPTYNIYRSDIASLFPGYANSNGALAYLDIDTTDYNNGVHTIEWRVRDNAGNIDGVGSRYFTIDNGSSGKAFSVGIVSPENEGSIAVTTGNINISGITSGTPTLSWTLNGVNKGNISHANGLWKLNNVKLAEGKNVFVVQAKVGAQKKQDSLYIFRNSKIDFSGSLTTTVDMVKIGVSQTAEFSIGIASGTTALTKMELISVDESGKIIKSLVQMKDNGVDPDDVPNDNIFTCRLAMKETQKKTNYFQAKAVLSTGTGISDIASVRFYKPITTAEIQKDMSIAKVGADQGKTPKEVSEWLDDQPGVTDIQYDDLAVTWTTENDIKYIISFTDPKTDGGKREENLTKGGRGQSNYYHFNRGSTAKTKSIYADQNQVGNKKVLIWAPYYWENSATSSYNFEDSVNTKFINHNHNFSVTYQKNTAASVESVKKWADYGIIYIHTHGGTLNDGIFVTGTQRTDQLMKTYETDLKKSGYGFQIQRTKMTIIGNFA